MPEPQRRRGAASHLRSVPEPHAQHSQPGDVIVLAETGHTRIILHGDIDHRLSDELEQAGSFCLNEHHPVVLDARKIQSIDSVGLSMIVRVAAALAQRGQRFSIQGPNQRLHELLAIVGAHTFVHWLPDIDHPA